MIHTIPRCLWATYILYSWHEPVTLKMNVAPDEVENIFLSQDASSTALLESWDSLKALSLRAFFIKDDNKTFFLKRRKNKR